jgi:RPA family protein
MESESDSTKKSYKRAPAIKSRITDILAGEFQQQGQFPVLISRLGEELRRVRILGTIIYKYDNALSRAETDSQTFIRINLTDESGVIPIKAWNQAYNQLVDYKEGDIVDIIGVPRKDDDNTPFISLELAIPVVNFNQELVRRTELITKYHTLGRLSLKQSSLIENDQPLSSNHIKILLIIKNIQASSSEGVTKEMISDELTDLSNDQIIECLSDLVCQGDIYTPQAEHYKCVN